MSETSEAGERGASQTAAAVLALRAAHQIIDGEPKVLSDPIAPLLLGAETRAAMLAHPERVQSPGARALRAHVLLRSRWAEDRLEAAVARGVRQYVLLGAGFDSFAYRQPEWARRLRIFEVDHPASQRGKQARLQAAGIATPPNLVLAPIDFEHTSLADGLARAGFDATAPAFVACLGVLLYLTDTAVDQLFAYVGRLPKTSEIVFTFTGSAAEADARTSTLAGLAAAVGEPWVSQLLEEELVPRLSGHGFSAVTVLQPAESAARYFAGRGDGLEAPERARIASAVI